MVYTEMFRAELPLWAMLLIVVKYTYYLGTKRCVYIYIYIYMCVCVCVCVYVKQLDSAVPRKYGCVHMKKFLANF
jgi:hypothetical protein